MAKNPQDSTLRNVRAATKRINVLERQVRRMYAQVKDLSQIQKRDARFNKKLVKTLTRAGVFIRP